jgi:hypothetical protein
MRLVPPELLMFVTPLLSAPTVLRDTMPLLEPKTAVPALLATVVFLLMRGAPTSRSVEPLPPLVKFAPRVNIRTNLVKLTVSHAMQERRELLCLLVFSVLQRTALAFPAPTVHTSLLQVKPYATSAPLELKVPTTSSVPIKLPPASLARKEHTNQLQDKEPAYNALRVSKAPTDPVFSATP